MEAGLKVQFNKRSLARYSYKSEPLGAYWLDASL
jgi:hypothetical protein